MRRRRQPEVVSGRATGARQSQGLDLLLADVLLLAGLLGRRRGVLPSLVTLVLARFGSGSLRLRMVLSETSV